MINKYICYKDFYYYLRYKKNNKIIFKCMGFSNLYKKIKNSNIDFNSIDFHCTFYELVRDYIYFESEKIDS